MIVAHIEARDFAIATNNWGQFEAITKELIKLLGRRQGCTNTLNIDRIRKVAPCQGANIGLFNYFDFVLTMSTSLSL